MAILKIVKSALLAGSLSVAMLPALAPSAWADTATATRFAGYATGGGIAAGIADMEKALAADSANGEARFGLGALQFLHAIEGLQQDLHRYGAGNQQLGRGMAVFLPGLRVPVTPNANPETASYEKTRAIFEKFVDRLKLADATLAEIGETPAKLPVDLYAITLDINGDGEPGEGETIRTLLTNMINPARGLKESDIKEFNIDFDTADAHWLRGYSNALMSLGNFFLSMDFEQSYDVALHTVFGTKATAFGQKLEGVKGDPEEIVALEKQIEELEAKRKNGFPKESQDRLRKLRRERNKIVRDKTLSKAKRDIELGKTKAEYDKLLAEQKQFNNIRREIRNLNRRLSALDPTASRASGGMFDQIFDPLSFLHTINWKVVEPDRLKAVRQNMLTVMELNRTTWRLVQAETDNEREWLPNPKQKSPFPGLEVTQETIDDWLKTIDAVEQVLEGKLLVPHMRFGRGTNMKRFFEEAKHFDLVLFLTGPNSIDYVEKGPIWSETLMRGMNRPLSRNFGAYALWFN